MSNGTPCPEANSMPSRNWACGSPEFASLVSSAMLWAESEGEPATAAADIRIKLRLQNVREAKRRLGIEQNPLERPAAETRLSHACLAHQRFPCEDPANGNRLLLWMCEILHRNLQNRTGKFQEIDPSQTQSRKKSKSRILTLPREGRASIHIRIRPSL